MSYFDKINGKQVIKEDLLDGKAEEIANSFLKQPLTEKRRERPLTSAQLRRFYADFKQLEKKVNLETRDFLETKPFIKMMKSKASYAANPDNQKIPTVFKNFLVNHVDQIHSKDDFKAFMLHFEAVVGFFYGLEGRSI